MKNRLIIITYFFVLMIFISCGQKIKTGTYLYHKGSSYFKFDKNHNYRFSFFAGEFNTYMFSKGKFKLNKNIISFSPDSSYFFTISVSKHAYDSSIKDDRKIVLHIADSLLKKFHFSFANDSKKNIVDFKTNTVIYKPTILDYRDDALTLEATLIDSNLINQKFLHDHLWSNMIGLIDINNDDKDRKPWNVLELNVAINFEMFAFTTLPMYRLRNGDLVEYNCPVYTFSKE